MFKVLIIHGWYHSKERYEKLSKQLKYCDCELIDLPGFGENRFHGNLSEIEDYHINYVSEKIKNNRYDYVIAHSWGARVLLKSIIRENNVNNLKIILLNPIYGMNTNLKRITRFEPIISKAFYLGKKLPNFLTLIPIKLISLISVNKWRAIDDLLVKDAKRADINVAVEILHIMATTSYYVDKKQYSNELFLIYSDRDRAVSKKCFEDLINDLNPCTHLIKGVGHTLVLEAFEELCKEINSIISKGGFSCEV